MTKYNTSQLYIALPRYDRFLTIQIQDVDGLRLGIFRNMELDYYLLWSTNNKYNQYYP